MTTAHKPTFHPAVGSAHQGGFRHIAPKVQVSVRDLAAHTKLKLRQPGQNAPSEIAVRDLKKELDAREKKHFSEAEKTKQQEKGLIEFNPEEKDDNGDSGDDRGGGGSDDDGSEDNSKPKVDLSQFDDADDAPEQSDTKDDDEDDEDEEAELLRELEKIKKERELENQRKEQEKQEEEAKARTEAVLRGNPLLQADFNVKRRWDDDVVFKNQARDEPKQQKRFINDTIRSDFHKNFLRKYID